MIRVLIVDDERPARDKVRALLADHGEVDIVGEASDGVEAVAAIRESRPDVVLLDVQMPRLDGFGVIQEIGSEEMPLVVFVTAHDEHALRAFEVHAFDYLLKPFASDRLHEALGRAAGRLLADAPDERSRRLGQLIGEVAPRGMSRILVEKSPHRELLLSVDHIDVVRAQRNYVEIVSNEGRYTRRGTLGAFEARLDPEQFLRINRSEIVRLEAIRELQPWFHGDYRVILHSGETLTWSRRYRAKQRTQFEM